MNPESTAYDVMFNIEGEDLVYSVTAPHDFEKSEGIEAFEYGVEGNRFTPTAFERILEKCLVKKMDIRELHDLEQDFERSRLEEWRHDENEEEDEYEDGEDEESAFEPDKTDKPFINIMTA